MKPRKKSATTAAKSAAAYRRKPILWSPAPRPAASSTRRASWVLLYSTKQGCRSCWSREHMTNLITKAVFPVAGLGTRFLPATKTSPKEMLPVVDKPLIQYAVEEAVAAGITELVFITGRSKRAIEDHFDKAFEVESELTTRGKHAMLAMVRDVVPRNVKCIYVRQQEALGLGHAVLCAQPVVGDQPFAVMLADDLIDAKPPVMKQMVDGYKRERCSLLGVQLVSRAETRQYGIVKAGRREGNLHPVTAIIEKPKPEAAPSRLG